MIACIISLFQYDSDGGAGSDRRPKKKTGKKKVSKEGGVFIRRNISVPRNTKIV